MSKGSISQVTKLQELEVLVSELKNTLAICDSLSLEDYDILHGDIEEIQWLIVKDMEE